jgi:putative SOS response-associated peptidase YedK
MCTRYVSPAARDIEAMWHVGRHNPWHGEQKEVFPSYLAPFIRAARETTEPERELVVGQWNLIPWFAKTPKQKYATANARSEELAAKATFKLPWARGQRCVVPAAAFFEPNWETGQHVPWRFRRTDGEHWGLAGLWNRWTDKSTGEIHESYTLLTLNADDHPIMRRMHRPDLSRPEHMQDKRSVVAIELEDVDTWLYGTQEEAQTLLKSPAQEALDALPMPKGVARTAAPASNDTLF